MDAMGYAAVSELSLGNGRRADILAVNSRARIIIVEIKSGRADFLTDNKWREYVDYCDYFYFAVDNEFPVDLLPIDTGLIVADRHGGSILREAVELPVNSNRRRSLILDLAMTAGRRLQRLEIGPDYL